MDQLSPLDSYFLASEVPGMPQHVGGLLLLDPRAAPGFGFETLLRVVAERIPLAPRHARRLREVPGGLDQPWLVDDPGFAVEHHVHRIAVPGPGTLHELADLAGLLFAPPLDRGRPLWEMWWIEGLADGRVALLMKSHHCLNDGAALAGLVALLCDLEPAPTRAPEKAAPEPAPDPGALRVAFEATRHLAGRPLAALRLGGSLLRAGVGRLRAQRDTDAPPLPFSIPRVSFNGHPGPRRAFACASLPLEAVREVRKRHAVTVNDVFLAVVGGAVRRYLEARGELPRESLVATFAVSLRDDDDAGEGNQVRVASIPWATDRADPVARLLRIHRAAERAKEAARGGDTQLLAQLGEAFAPGLVNLLFRAGGARGTAMFMPGNVVVSNLRGPQRPLHLAGARVDALLPLSILPPTQGLNVTALSYCGRIDVGLTADPDLLRDPWELAEGMPLALAELRAAA